MGNDIPIGSWDAVRNDPRWKDLVRTTPLVATNFLWINVGMTDTPLGNVKVRQAIHHAIDKANIQKVIGEGRSTAATQIFPPLMPGHDPTFDPYPYDPAKAKSLLAEGGYADGFSTTLYADSQDSTKAVVEAMQRDLAAVGITVEIVQQPFDVLLGTISTPKTAPLTLIGWFQDYPDPSDFIDPLFSCVTAVEGGSNTSFYCNPAIDEQAAAANVEPDRAKRLELYRDVQAAIMADAPAVPIDHPATVPLVAERVTNFFIHPVWFYELSRYRLSE
jgi:peptide/nickel transport system substrate-binding protein/oligopeptide transport system substrate-binding protein